MSAALSLHVALSLRLDAVEAYRLAHAYRDEVAARTLREAADLAEQRTGSPADQRVLLDFATQLRREANVREEATAPAATAAPDFFQPGRTYARGFTTSAPLREMWNFKVAAVADGPDGLTTALGFLHGATYGSGVWTPRGEYEFDGWTDVTEAGAR